MINTRSFYFIFVEFHRHFKIQNPKTKRFLNKTIFLNFIHAITSTKFFIDFVTKTTIFNLNNLKMINVLNLIISTSFALMQMLKNVVENWNSSKHSSLARLNKSVKTGWEVMVPFVIGFDSLIVFYSPFHFSFSSFFSGLFRESTSSRPTTPPQGGRAEEENEKKAAAMFFFWIEVILNPVIS